MNICDWNRWEKGRPCVDRGLCVSPSTFLSTSLEPPLLKRFVSQKLSPVTCIRCLIWTSKHPSGMSVLPPYSRSGNYAWSGGWRNMLSPQLHVGLETWRALELPKDALTSAPHDAFLCCGLAAPGAACCRLGPWIGRLSREHRTQAGSLAVTFWFSETSGRSPVITAALWHFSFSKA